MFDAFAIGHEKRFSAFETRFVRAKVVAKIGGEIAIQHIAYGEAYGDDFEDIQRRVPEVDKLEQTIGSKPNMTLDQILDDIIAWKRSATGEEDQDRS